MTAILLSNFVWEGTAPEMTDALPGLMDGHIYKQLDTGESYIRRNGAWAFINLGLAFIKATKSGSVVTDGSGLATVTFATPFINNLYTVALTCMDSPGPPIVVALPYVFNQTPAGFSIITRRIGGSPVGGITVSYLSTRDYDP